MKAAILGTRVGQPRLIGQWRGRDVVSAIGKQPVTAASVLLDKGGIAGDGQADPRVHGGARKAVYAYPQEHMTAWRRDLPDAVLDDGVFGENLMLSGLLESQVQVGDIWLWGEALLEVTTPRQPCYKLIIHSGVPDIIQRMRSNGRVGWYLRVIQGGSAPSVGRLQLIVRGAGPTVEEIYAEKARRPLDPAFLG